MPISYKWSYKPLDYTAIHSINVSQCYLLHLFLWTLNAVLPHTDFLNLMYWFYNDFSSVQSLSPVWLFVTPWTAACQTSLSITNPGAYSNSCPSRWWCLPAISSSVIPFSSCLQSFPVSGSFQMSQFFTSDGQSIGAAALVSVLPMNTQFRFPLGWTDLISLQSKGLSRVFNTTMWKDQFFNTQLSLWSNSYILTNHSFD